ncbi:hypothetical protein [Zoo ranavirus]|uniref:Uncharacterized protein n=1 Tax=Zoo ranavirus TaxID=1419340 RepID=A0A3Q8UGT2_FRG3V|nr:hypothetical protein [Zoo ranavirus]
MTAFPKFKPYGFSVYNPWDPIFLSMSQRGAWISGPGRRRGRCGARGPKGRQRSRRPKGTLGSRNLLTGMYLESVSRGLLSSRD